MPKKNSDAVMDRLRLALADSNPEDKELRWEIAKAEISSMTEQTGPSKADVGSFCLLLGVGLGVYFVKWFPTTKVVKQVKYIQEAFKAQRRLSKIMLEEYERFDDALDAEQKFLEMMGQDLPIEAKLSLEDEAGQRRVHMEIKTKKKSKKEDE